MRSAYRTLVPLVALACLATMSSAAARAEGRLSLVESTYVERGSVALAYRSASVAGRPTPLIGVEWSWLAHPRLSLGLGLGTSVGSVAVDAPAAGPGTKEASLVQACLRAESPVYEWQILTITADLEVGTTEVGYRGRFDGAETRKWQGDQGALFGLGSTTYVHVSPETDLGLGLGYQATKGLKLPGLDDAGMAGMTIGLRLKRWF